MKTPEEYEERNIKVLIKGLNAIECQAEAFGVSYVQRTCEIGYNQAMYTIERALKQGVLVKDTERGHLYRLAS